MPQRAKYMMTQEYGTLSNATTSVNTYADVGTIACSAYKTKHFAFVVTTNNLHVKVLGSIDGGTTYPFTDVTDLACNVGTTTRTITTPYTNIKIQVKPAVNDTHGTLATSWMGAGW